MSGCDSKIRVMKTALRYMIVGLLALAAFGLMYLSGRTCYADSPGDLMHWANGVRCDFEDH